MNKFRFKFSALVYVLIIAVILFALGGLFFNVYSIVYYLKVDIKQNVLYIITSILVFLLLIIAVSLLFHSKYEIKNGKIYSYFGFFVTKYNIEDVVSFTHFHKLDKLVMYFKDNTYTVIVIDNKQYDNFYKAVREINGNVIFTSNIENENN